MASVYTVAQVTSYISHLFEERFRPEEDFHSGRDF